MSLEVAVALSDRPRRCAHQRRPGRALIVGCKRDRPDWGAHKIRELLVRRLDGDIRFLPRAPLTSCSMGRPGQHAWPGTPLGRWSAAINRDGAERSPMRPSLRASSSSARLVLLSADPDQSCLALSLALQSSPRHAKISRSPLRTALPGTRPATPPALTTASPSPAQAHLQPFRVLGMVAPAVPPSPRPYTGPPDLTYPARPRGPRHRPRPHLHASQARQHLNRARRSTPRHRESRQRHLDRQFHELRSRLQRLAAENPATLGQPSRPKDVTHVLGTYRYPWVRSADGGGWRMGWDSNPR